MPLQVDLHDVVAALSAILAYSEGYLRLMIDNAAWQERLERIAFYLTCGSAAAVFVSIAVCHTLLALSVIALLVSGAKLRFPPIKLPLAVFAALTVISLALSANPAAGRPQIRKFFVFLVLLTVASLVRKCAPYAAWCWCGSAWRRFRPRSLWCNSGGRIEQAQQAGMNFYDYYVSERITGFMSHWMTSAAR